MHYAYSLSIFRLKVRVLQKKACEELWRPVLRHFYGPLGRNENWVQCGTLHSPNLNRKRLPVCRTLLIGQLRNDPSSPHTTGYPILFPHRGGSTMQSSTSRSYKCSAFVFSSEGHGWRAQVSPSQQGYFRDCRFLARHLTGKFDTAFRKSIAEARREASGSERGKEDAEETFLRDKKDAEKARARDRSNGTMTFIELWLGMFL